MKLNYKFPRFGMSKKEEEGITKKLDTRARGMTGSFLKGLFFFITIPISIYNKIKNKKAR